MRVFADLDADLEEDVEDLVAVQLDIFVLIYSSLILYLSYFLNVVCRQFFSALRWFDNLFQRNVVKSLDFKGLIVRLQLAEQLFSHVHDGVHHRYWIFFKLRARLSM